LALRYSSWAACPTTSLVVFFSLGVSRLLVGRIAPVMSYFVSRGHLFGFPTTQGLLSDQPKGCSSIFRRDLLKGFTPQWQVYSYTEGTWICTLEQRPSNTLFSVYSRTILVLGSNSIRLAAVISIGIWFFWGSPRPGDHLTLPFQ